MSDNWKVENYIARLNDRKQILAALHQDREDAELKTEPDLLATFELSYAQLSQEVQKGWRVLGVFPGLFDAQATQAMWEMQENETLRLLGLLCRYSLLDYDEASSRYHLHDLLGKYACSKMDDGEEVSARISHARHYSEVLGNINHMFLQGGANILPALRMYDTEWTNIETAQKTSALELENSEEAARACNWFAWQDSINNLRLKPGQQIKWIEDGIRAARMLGNKEAEGAALGNLGLAYADLGDARKAIEFYEQALVIDREIGDRRGEGVDLFNMGLALYGLEEKDRAVDLVKQALAIYEAIESPYAENARETLREWGVLPKEDHSQAA